MHAPPRFFVGLMSDRFSQANIVLLARREIRGRFVDTYFGLGHYVLLPILMLTIYTFVFGVIFQSRWPNVGGGIYDFAARMFIGLIAFQFFSEVVNRAPGLVLENPTYVKKVLFPLETLVPIAVLVGLFSSVISMAVFLAGYLLTMGLPPIEILWVPVIWVPLILITAGFSWALAALGVYLRDIKQLVGVAVSVMLFLSPLFYPISAVPEAYRPLLLINPLTFIIESMRNAAFLGDSPALLPLLVLFIISIAIAQFGYWVFIRTKRGFADVV